MTMYCGTTAWEEPQGKPVRCSIGYGDANRNIVYICFGVLHLDVEIAICVEDAGVEELKLRLAFSPLGVLFDKLAVRKRPLRILVEELHVRVGGR